MADFEGMDGRADHEKEDLPVESLEVSELEEGDLDNVSGGDNACPQTNNCTNGTCGPTGVPTLNNCGSN